MRNVRMDSESLLHQSVRTLIHGFNMLNMRMDSESWATPRAKPAESVSIFEMWELIVKVLLRWLSKGASAVSI